MPLYEYACRACGRRFEVLQRVGASAAEVSCPGCGGREVAKQLSTFASTNTSTSGSASALPCGASSASACGGGFS